MGNDWDIDADTWDAMRRCPYSAADCWVMVPLQGDEAECLPGPSPAQRLPPGCLPAAVFVCEHERAPVSELCALMIEGSDCPIPLKERS